MHEKDITPDDLARLRRRLDRERRARLEAERIAEQYTREAMRDRLTGLASRALLIDRLDLALSQASVSGGLLGLLFIDLDDFKAVNDTLGHSVGDQLLIEVAQRLTRLVRATDVVARMGGDEFVVLCPHVPDTNTLDLLSRRVAQQLAEPCVLDGNELIPRASVGVRLAHGTDRADRVLQDADAAMYTAKRSGVHGYVRFDADAPGEPVRWADLRRDLRPALLVDEIALYLRPVKGLVGAEAATGPAGFAAGPGWQHPQHGFIPPEFLVSLAASIGVAGPVARRVLGDACAAAARHGFERGQSLYLNVGTAALADPDFSTWVDAALRHSGLDPAVVCLELAPDGELRQRQGLPATLEAVRASGVRLAIGGMGAGATFDHLRRLPADVLMLDESLVGTLHEHPRDRVVAAAVVAAARVIGLRTVATCGSLGPIERILRDLDVHEVAHGQWQPDQPAPAPGDLRFQPT